MIITEEDIPRIAEKEWESLEEFERDDIIEKFEVDYCYWSFESFGEAFSDFAGHVWNLIWFAACGADGDSAVEIWRHIQRGTMPVGWFDKTVDKMNEDGLMFAGKCRAVVRYERIVNDFAEHCILVGQYEPSDEDAMYFTSHAMRGLAIKYNDRQNRLSGKVATIKF